MKLLQFESARAAELTIPSTMDDNDHNNAARSPESGTGKPASNFLVVRGIRYVVPYMKEQRYSLRLQHAGKSAAVVLAQAFHRRSNNLDDTIRYYRREISEGRVELERHKKSIDDSSPFTTSTVLLDPDMPTERQDRFKLQQHVHERCTIYRGPLQVIFNGKDGSYRAIFKPCGLPVIDDQGGFNSVPGLLEGENYLPGHRLDLPVSGVLLLAKGKRRTARLLKALAPEGKKRERVLKAYLARVKGEMREEQAGEILLKLRWDNRSKKAIVDEKDGRQTITRISKLRFDEETGESLVRVELGSGARQQVRAVLASMGLPILGDVRYGGVTYFQQEKLLLYADDDQGHLLQMLRKERVGWCDKCRWQIEEAESGGTQRGTERLAEQICLLSYHYRISSLGIDVCVPEHMIPPWAK